MRAPEPILVADLFPEVRKHLLSLLDGLSAEEWALPTAAPNWSVKDVALHLLGGHVGNLSRRRDKFMLPGPAMAEYRDLVAFINQINETWVVAARRMSPRLLCDLLAVTGPQMEEYFASLDPFAMGTPVSWAGPEPAPNWLDVAREYTEQWHHQQQIRDATGRPGLYDERLFAPVLDTFVRALPYAFRNVEGHAGDAVQLRISGAGGGDYVLRRETNGWALLVGRTDAAIAEVVLEDTAAWKIFTRGIRGEEAARRAKFHGDRVIGGKVLETVSVIA